MSNQASLEREVRELLIAANSGEASDEQIARLDQLILSDPRVAAYVAKFSDQQASLIWLGSMRAQPAEAAACATLAGLAGGMDDDSSVNRRRSKNAHVLRSWSSLAVGIGFVLGGLTVAAFYRATANSNVASLVAPAENAQAIDEPTYAARLTHSTACLWDGSTTSARQIGSELSTGESVHLLEGLAEFDLNWSHNGRATLSLEGPAAMVLTSNGMPTLRFGRLSASILSAEHPLVLETPIGRLTISDVSSVGVSAFGNEGEIHVFNGTAKFETAWRSPDQTQPLNIDAGQSIRIQTGENGEPQVSWHAADPEYFAAQVSMTSDRLAIPTSYVDAVKKSQPLGYWRFERDEWPNVPNAMGPRFSCHVNGSLGRAVYPANQAVEFGVTGEGGEIISNDVLDDSIHDSYSVEFWVKPSHYHVGAVVSLVGDTPTPSGILPHGMLVELGGTGKIPTAIHHPGCIRFLHRSPASNIAGTSCYSDTPYTLRKWQHVVATKEGANMRLYINGELVAEGEDPSPLPSGLRLLVGKLYPASGDRPFIGQLDELALYNRALKPEEIGAHYHLVRPSKTGESSI